jgi:hypothetical protein
MKKKLILLSIILFPSLIYLFFQLTQANFKKMAYFGPKTVNEKGDTVYYSVPKTIFLNKLITIEEIGADNEGKEFSTLIWKADSVSIDTTNYPVYLIMFIDSKLKKEGYKLGGMYDYMKYKAKDLKGMPIFIVSDFSEALDGGKKEVELRGEFDSLKITLSNFHPLLCDLKSRQQFLANTYFKQKPYYAFDYFIVLVDKKRHIRGYYDPSFNAEIKRMVLDYQHLKIRDESAQTQKQNDIKQN